MLKTILTCNSTYLKIYWSTNEWEFKDMEICLKTHNAILQEQVGHLLVIFQNDQVSPEQEQNNVFVTLSVHNEVQ